MEGGRVGKGQEEGLYQRLLLKIKEKELVKLATQLYPVPLINFLCSPFARYRSLLADSQLLITHLLLS